jgi:dihydrodipicolinate synthase/N-acetylneuraminate lyase
MTASITRYPQSNLGAILLPWTDTNELDVPGFEKQIRSTLEEGFACFYILGTAGEGFAVDDILFRQIVDIYAANSVVDGNDPQVALISLSMRDLMRRMEYCYSKGIRMFQLALPGWGPLTDAEMVTFFQSVCGAAPDCRFLHYNNPRTKRHLNAGDYVRLIEAVPNLVATKNSGGNYGFIADLMKRAPQLQHFLLENGFAIGCLFGECSLLCSYDQLFPNTTRKFFEAGVRRDQVALFQYQEFFHSVGADLFGHCADGKIDSAYDKTLAWLADPSFSYRLLPPYQGMSEAEANECRRMYETHYRDVE